MKLSNIIAVLFILLQIACGSEGEKPTTTISGEIIDPVDDKVTFLFNDSEVTDTLNAEGQFSVSLDLREAVAVMLKHGDEFSRLYIRPGDNLSLSLNPKQFDETLTYTGRGSKINNYQAAMILMSDSLPGPRELYTMSEAKFIKTMDSIDAVKLSYLEDFEIEDQQFIDFTVNTLKWQQANYKQVYEGAYRSLTGVDTFTVSEDFYAFKNELDINDSTLLHIPNFVRYISSHASNLSREYQKEVDTTFSPAYYAVIKDSFDNKAVQERLIYELLKMNLTYMGDSERKQMVSAWKEMEPSTERLIVINEKLADWDRISPGNPAPSFRFASIDGDTLSLQDFRGKVVYVDVWATWCGPCIREHPYMEELQNEFEGEEVAFIAIGTDNSPEPWRKMVQDKALSGIHLYAPDAGSDQLKKDYIINGIPRFILIDQQGNIVDPNAARPSGDIDKQIADLLKST